MGDDFIEIERYHIVPQISGKGGTVSIRYFTTDSGFPDGDSSVSGYLGLEFILPLDLEFVEF